MAHEYASPALEPWMLQYLPAPAETASVDALRDELVEWRQRAVVAEKMLESRNRYCLTAYDFAREDDAVDALLEQLGRQRQFVVHEQVQSQSIRTRAWQRDKKRYRIDLVLEPTSELRESGWPYGIIGIECKKSRVKLGRPIAQMLDYHDATWDVDGQETVLDHVFLWPCLPQGGPLGSLLAQFHMGTVFGCPGGVAFNWGPTWVFSVVGQTVDWRHIEQGSRAGSR